MNIGIIVYSQTGNTLYVAKKLKEKLLEAGHTANIEQIEAIGEVKDRGQNIQFKTLPDTKACDALVFASMVQAFSISIVMKKYLEQIESLKGKKIACFVTKGLPFHWTGGNNAINQMKKICESKDAIICGTGIIVWKNKKREQNINNMINKLSKLF